ncbi:hypothetical protein [Pseudooceanicola sp. MF1-13]|uniref:hypothetical protein n=1 Tax=Pseudooceanicola sp. MF1-13 TaxID=3379095 RepID=UPI0038918C37
MTNMTRNTIVALAFAITGTMALSQSASDALVAQLSEQGFSRIEVKTGLSQTKIEATNGVEKHEYVIDNVTGGMLKSEVGALDADDSNRPGIFTRLSQANFLRGDDDGHRGHGSDDDGDHGDDDHGERGDDHSGSGRDHDRGDDHGDDHGGDHNGDHDSGRGDDGGHGSDHD